MLASTSTFRRETGLWDSSPWRCCSSAANYTLTSSRTPVVATIIMTAVQRDVDWRHRPAAGRLFASAACLREFLCRSNDRFLVDVGHLCLIATVTPLVQTTSKFTLEMNLNPASHQNLVKTVLKTGFKFRELWSVPQQSWIFVDRQTSVQHVSVCFGIFVLS